jgi:ligand-binding sensor domain-containing protein/serine phosphatase RsbU (regulator of sigma subunit)
VKKLWHILIISIACASACKQERVTESNSSDQIKIFTCNPTVFRLDTLPQPEPIPLEFDKLKTHKLALSEPGEPLFREFKLGPGQTHPLITEKTVKKFPGDGQTEPSISTILKGTKRKLRLPTEVEVQHFFSPRQNALSFLSLGKLEGLLHNVVLEISTDTCGNLWLATEGGLTKFDGREINNYTVSQGLESNIIYSVYHDSKNRIWAGSLKNGLDLIDGENVTHFGQKEGFGDVTILAITEDKAGNIWIGTDGNEFGLWKFDGQNFTHYRPKNGCPIIRVEDILVDHSGNIWVAGKGGATKFDGQVFEHFNSTNGLPMNFVSCIVEDNSHRIWMGSNQEGGLICFDGTKFTKYLSQDSLLSDVINCIKPIENGEIWVGHDKGITVINNGKCNYLDMNSGLPSADIRDILQDQYKQIWIGTRAGITKFKGDLFSHYSSSNGIVAESIYSVAHDDNSSYWVGTGSGLNRFDGKRFSSFLSSPDFEIRDTRSIAKGTGGVTWFGTNSGLISYQDGEFRIIDKNIGFLKNRQVDTKQIFKVFKDNANQIWLGTKHGLTKYDQHFLTNYNALELGFPIKTNDSQQISAEQFPLMCRVYDINQDSEGNLWFAIWGYGLIKYDGLHFSHFSTSNGLPNRHPQCMVIDNKNRKWIGTEEGLIVMKEDSFIVFNQANGLSNSNVQALQIDPYGNVWIGTRDGLNKLDFNDIEKFLDSNTSEKDFLKKYNFDDGLILIGVGRNGLYFDPEGRLWIGGNNLLSVHHPEKNTYRDPPAISLSSLDLFNDKIAWGELLSNRDTSINLSNGMILSGFEYDSVSLWNQLPLNASFRYNNNFLTFNFVGATTYQPEQVKYQYMLEGWDESWSGITARTSAPYGNLPPGNYTFAVKAMSSSGVWSEPLRYNFTIRPPWFWNIWSKMGYLLSIATVIISLFRWRTSELRKRQRELEDTVRERTSEIAKKHREITDSINYAERIQRSLMASKNLLETNLPEHFVYFNPKERVSGDFFWACELPNEKFALACADSTGHGVPGAIMSMLNIAALERAVDGEGHTEPNLILDSARKKVIKTLAQDGSEEGGRDGMDAVLVSLDMKKRTLVAALANMQLWIMGSGEKRAIAPDKMPIGKHDKQDIPFTRHELQLKKGDVIYMFSDGYVDQFGGPNGKKFKYRPFEELLFSIHQLPIKEQQVIIRMHFENWMGDLEQVDDVCVIGIRM